MWLLGCSEWLLGCCYVIAGLLLCDCYAVTMRLLGCCYVVGGLLLCDCLGVLSDCWAVAMWLLGCSEWLLGCCYVIAGLLLCDCYAVTMRLLGCCYVVGGLLLCDCLGVLSDCWAVAMWLLGCYEWLLGCCYVIAGLFLCDCWGVLSGCWDDLSGWLTSFLSASLCQISVGSGVAEAVELQSCLVSPLSDPQAHSGWSIIRDSCPTDLSFKLSHRETQESTDSTGHDEDEKSDRKDDRRLETGDWRQMASHSREESARRNKDKRPDRLGARKPEERRWKRREDERESANMLRFSFILRPIINNSIQFLHCRLHLCASEEGPSGASTRICTDGPQIPALTHTTASQQVMNSNVRKLASWNFESVDSIVLQNDLLFRSIHKH